MGADVVAGTGTNVVVGMGMDVVAEMEPDVVAGVPGTDVVVGMGMEQSGVSAPLVHCTRTLTPTMAICLRESLEMRLNTPSGGIVAPKTKASSTIVSVPSSMAVILATSWTEPCGCMSCVHACR